MRINGEANQFASTETGHYRDEYSLALIFDFISDGKIAFDY